MPIAELTLSSKNYSSWSLRGWLLCRIAGLKVEEKLVALDDPENRAELLLLSPSVLVPRLTHEELAAWTADAHMATGVEQTVFRLFHADDTHLSVSRLISNIQDFVIELGNILPLLIVSRHSSSKFHLLTWSCGYNFF